MVNIFYEDTETLDLDPGFYNAWFEKVCGAEDMGLGGVVLVFCSDSYLLEINQFRNPWAEEIISLPGPYWYLWAELRMSLSTPDLLLFFESF